MNSDLCACLIDVHGDRPSGSDRDTLSVRDAARGSEGACASREAFALAESLRRFAALTGLKVIPYKHVRPLYNNPFFVQAARMQIVIPPVRLGLHIQVCLSIQVETPKERFTVSLGCPDCDCLKKQRRRRQQKSLLCLLRIPRSG